MASPSVNLIRRLGGESITYTPVGETPRTLTALVQRKPVQPQPAAGHSFGATAFEMWIPRDATDGVMKVTERQDQVTLKRHLDDDATTEFRVLKILEEDAGMVAGDGGMWHLAIQA